MVKETLKPMHSVAGPRANLQPETSEQDGCCTNLKQMPFIPKAVISKAKASKALFDHILRKNPQPKNEKTLLSFLDFCVFFFLFPEFPDFLELFVHATSNISSWGRGTRFFLLFKEFSFNAKCQHFISIANRARHDKETRLIFFDPSQQRIASLDGIGLLLCVRTNP
jgi:hypothetical protein